MTSPRRLRPSPAFVLACLALFVALGGSAYAVVRLNGKNLVNRSVSGKKLKKNTVTGSEVKESSLGKVPTAATADRATSAANADHATSATAATSAGTAADAAKLGGQSPSSYLSSNQLQSSGFKASTAVPASTTTTLLTRGPITFSSDCTDLGGGSFRVDVNAVSSEPNSLLGGTGGQSPLSGTPTSVYNVSGTAAILRGGLAASIVSPSSTFHAFITVGVHVAGHDCIAGVVAMP